MTDEELKTIREEYQDDTTPMELVGEIDALKVMVRILQNRCRVLSRGTLCSLCNIGEGCIHWMSAGE